MKLSEAWAIYLKDKKLERYAVDTLNGYKWQIKLLISYLGDKDIEDVTTPELKEYLATQTHLKPSSLAHRVHFVKSLFGWAHEEDYINRNPALKIKEPKLDQRIPKDLSIEDIERLRIGAKTPFENLLVEFFHSTGCRIGEAVRVNINDINWENNSVIVFGKGAKEREVFFSTRAEIWVKRYLDTRKDNDPALFVTQRAPHRMSISRMRGVLKEVAKRGKVKNNVTPHRMRHTFCMHLLNRGAPITLIQSLVGHAKLSTTQLYTYLTGKARKIGYERYY